MSSRYSQPLVLEYKKRRYDGGSEIEIIEHIERQYEAYEQQRMLNGWSMVTPPPIQPMAQPPMANVGQPGQPVPPSPPPAPVAKKLSFRDKLYKAFIIPWVELVLGLSGITIGMIMSVTLVKGATVNLEILKRERETLIRQSSVVVRNSVLGILFSPITAVKLCLSR